MKNLLERVIADKPECMMRIIEDSSVYQGGIYRFIKEEYWQNDATINIFEVCGSNHPDYIEKSYFNLLLNGKRMNQNLQMFHENPTYYTDSTLKDPTMYYSKHDDKLYLSGDGNHRTTIAKAYFHYLERDDFAGVKLTEYIIDHELDQAFNKFLRLSKERKRPILVAELLSRLVGRDDGAGWQRNKYELSVKVMNVLTGNVLILNLQQLTDLLEELEANPWLRMFRSNKYAKFLR